MLNARRYTADFSDPWNEFVQSSRNGTFLHDRRYMDYHKDRFQDHSLLVTDGDQTVALLPANLAPDNALYSHQGLTYGGLIVQSAMTTPLALDVFNTIAAALGDTGISKVIYKEVPAIYHTTHGEEDLYALHQSGATVIRRDTFSVIDLTKPRTVQTRRKRGAAKARKAGVTVDPAATLDAFWPVLEARLADTHGANPVHSLDEIVRLQALFPDHITVVAARAEGNIVAGLVLYDTGRVVRAQYIAASDKGQEMGALDLLISETCARFETSRPYVDLGSSNAVDGNRLNRGLIEFKEGFGARTVVHDVYEWNLH